MSGTKFVLGVAAGLLVLAGCSSGDDSTAPPVSTPAATSSAPGSASPPPAASPTATAQPSGSLSTTALSLAESCRAVVADQEGALDAIREYVKNPLSGNASVQELDQIRTELRVDEVSAPEPLRQHLNTQVGVLNSVIQAIQDRDVTQVDVTAFQEAGTQILQICAAQTR